MLAGTEIAKAITAGRWRAWRDGEPIGVADLKIGPHSCDVTLQDELLLIHPNPDFGWFIDPNVPESMSVERVTISDSYSGLFVLSPGDFVLGATRERFECDAALNWGTTEPQTTHGLSYFHQVYEGRSTCARLGLSSHQCAGYCDWGFSGTITLELSALVPVRLYAGMRIGQISWSPVEGCPEPYLGAYNGQSGPRAAELGPHRF